MNDQFTLMARTATLHNVLERTVIKTFHGSEQPLERGITEFCRLMHDLRSNGGTLFVIGNGGSAGIASHAATDFFNVCKIRAMTLHETSLMTCMANDFAYENAFARMVGQMGKPNDMMIAISSSGNSMNIRNAVEQARNQNMITVTLSGFSADNPLRSMGNLNIWLDSRDYGIVEVGHQAILHNVSDRFGAGLVA